MAEFQRSPSIERGASGVPALRPDLGALGDECGVAAQSLGRAEQSAEARAFQELGVAGKPAEQTICGLLQGLLGLIEFPALAQPSKLREHSAKVFDNSS